MAILDIVIAPAPVLAAKAEPVAKVDSSIKKLMDDMLETMYDAPGVGLAAPQIGVSKRVIVIDITVSRSTPESEKSPLCLANPVIISKSEDHCIDEEGCLSAPDLFADVERSCEVEIEYLDYNGKKQSLKADGLLAVCIQHEIDHLDGIMFYEHISSLRRNMIVRKLKKLQKEISK
jgi:peptide deformylase